MDKIAGDKGIKNPYKKLNLVKDEKVRVKHLREAAKLFHVELKTRKRGDTLVDNHFFKNEKLKDLLSKENLPPKSLKDIHSEVEKDFGNFISDIGVVEKNKKTPSTLSDKVSLARNYTLTGYNLRSKIIRKAVLPVGKSALVFAGRHKMLTVGVGCAIFIATSSGISMDKKIDERLKGAASMQVIDFKGNDQISNIVTDTGDFTKLDYHKLVETMASQDLDRNLYFKKDSEEIKEFSSLYKNFFTQLKEKQGDKPELKLSDSEGKAFLGFIYVATNSQLEVLKNNNRGLSGSELKSNELEIARYANQLQSIQGSIADVESGREGNQVRTIYSGGNTNYKYLTSKDGKFVVRGIEKRNFE